MKWLNTFNRTEVEKKPKEEVIVFFNSQQFFSRIQKLKHIAGHNEFGLLFSSLTAKLKDENTWVVFPIVFYTYPQYVTCGSIKFKYDFHDERFQRCFNGIYNLTKRIVEPILEDPILGQIFEEYTIIPFNTIHKHPNEVSSFSSTDHHGILNKKYSGEIPIICVDGLMYTDPDSIVRFEGRLLTSNKTFQLDTLFIDINNKFVYTHKHNSFIQSLIVDGILAQFISSDGEIFVFPVTSDIKNLYSLVYDKITPKYYVYPHHIQKEKRGGVKSYVYGFGYHKKSKSIANKSISSKSRAIANKKLTTQTKNEGSRRFEDQGFCSSWIDSFTSFLEKLKQKVKYMGM